MTIPPLAHLELFADLPSAVVARLVDHLPMHTLRAGERFDVSETDAACCLVAAGRAALEFRTEADTRRTASLLEQGDLLVRPVQTWAAVGPRLEARAIEDTHILIVGHERMALWLTVPTLAQNIVRTLSAQVADRELALAITLEPRMERRLLLKLRQIGLRWGRVTPEGVRLDLRLTHQELAEMIGGARESVTLALGRLAEQGLVEVRNRVVIITRPSD